MLFTGGMFSPELAPSPKVKAVLCAAARQPKEVLRSRDLIASVLRHGDDNVRRTLTRALRPGFSLENVLRSLENGRTVEHTRATPRIRDSFTPEALAALNDFESALTETAGDRDKIALELLTLCLLAHLDEHDRAGLTALDTNLAVTLLLDQLAREIDFQPLVDKFFRKLCDIDAENSLTGDESFLLPEELAPSDDLTYRARTAERVDAFPFDNEPQYDRLFDTIARVLHRRQGNHVLLTGERGAGKSTVVAELARRAAVAQIASLSDRRFLYVDCHLIPPDESRERLVAILSRIVDHPELVVTLDGFTSMLRSERGVGNKAILLSALSRARCRIIGLLTPHEYEELLSNDPDFAELFTRVDVEEPDIEVALKLLKHFALALERQFSLTIDNEAVHQAVLLSANYILNDHLPAKALKVLHRACEDLDYERTHLGSPHSRITADDAIRVVAQTSGVPEETLRGIAERPDYEHSLRELVVGQDRAVREVATELGLIKAGMTDPNKPASVMLFLGQTGTGKTELAKALARFYSTSRRLKTYTLGNCVEPHSVATIIGVPPGYVGHDQGGRLVNDLNADPYCVFLLDEADKAHPDVLQPFLNLFDEGWVVDQRGAKAYADKAIFILTSNVGQRMIAEMVREGKGMDEITSRMKEALSQIRHTKSDRPVFTPEFLARIKRIIVFNSLDQTAMQGITRKLVKEMQHLWATKRGKLLEVPEALIQHLADQAHRLNQQSSGKEGGRIVRKLLADWVEARVQRAVSERPAEYRANAAVTLEFTPPEPEVSGGTPAAPTISVHFVSSDAR